MSKNKKWKRNSEKSTATFVLPIDVVDAVSVAADGPWAAVIARGLIIDSEKGVRFQLR